MLLPKYLNNTAFTFSRLGQVTLNAKPLKTKLPEHSEVEFLPTGRYVLSKAESLTKTDFSKLVNQSISNKPKKKITVR
jgi:hypothetical protein